MVKTVSKKKSNECRESILGILDTEIKELNKIREKRNTLSTLKIDSLYLLNNIILIKFKGFNTYSDVPFISFQVWVSLISDHCIKELAKI